MSALSQANTKTLTIAIIAAAILLTAAYTATKTLTDKAGQQQASLDQINRWKAEYELLKPFQTEWNTTLKSAEEITDLYRVYAALDLPQYGLTTDQEKINISTIEPLAPNGTPIQATRVCLKTATTNGLSLTAPRFSPGLLEGIENLAARRDVEIRNILLTTENHTPRAVMDFCLIFRS